LVGEGVDEGPWPYAEPDSDAHAVEYEEANVEKEEDNADIVQPGGPIWYCGLVSPSIAFVVRRANPQYLHE
jgi:hypothetical protein